MQGSSYTDADGVHPLEDHRYGTSGGGTHSKRPALHGVDLNEDSE